jgi:hypothetical protein
MIQAYELKEGRTYSCAITDCYNGVVLTTFMQCDFEEVG